MIKRTIEISRAPAYLCVKHGQLVIRPRESEGSRDTSIPCEDIGVVVLDEPGTIITHGALSNLTACGAVVVLCGRDHLPAGLLLPTGNHNELVTRLHEQIAAKLPLKKRLWQQLVVGKIRAQAANLPDGTPARRKLTELSRDVRSGDPSNVEAQAAKVYWGAWLGDNRTGRGNRFRRDPDGAPPNNLLNYGYAVVRAVVARALVVAGLTPALGLHHSNRSNAFCLADDLVEPLRPIVDACVRSLFLEGKTMVGPTTKTPLLELLAVSADTVGERGPLMVGVQRMVASLVRSYAGESRDLAIPTVRVEDAPC